MSYRTIQLYCLPGTPVTDTGTMDARLAASGGSAAGLLRALTRRYPVTTADDFGALVLWYDPTDKCWRGERNYRWATVDEASFRTAAELLPWVEKALCHIRGEEFQPQPTP